MRLIDTLINKYKELPQLQKNIFSGPVYSGFNIVATLIAYPIYLKYLGAEKYGLWATVTVVLAFSQFGLLGIDNALIKYVAEMYGKKDSKGITEYVSTSFYLLLVPSLLVIILIGIFKTRIVEFLKFKEVFLAEGTRLMFLVTILSIFSLYVLLVQAIIIGIGRMDIANYSISISRILQVVLVVSLLIAGCGIWSLYFGFLFYNIFALLIWIPRLEKVYHIRIFSPLAFKREKLSQLIKFGGLLSTGRFANLFINPFNRVIIARYVGLSEVTYFEIALRVVLAIRTFFSKGLVAILPIISEIQSRAVDSIKPYISIHKKGMRFILCWASPLFLLVFVFANPILKYWLGAEFDIQIAQVLRILLLGWFLNLLIVPDYLMFLGFGKVSYSVGEEWIKAVVNFFVIMILIFANIDMSLTKVAIVNTVSFVAGFVYLKYQYFRFLNNPKAILTYGKDAAQSVDLV